MNRLKTSGYGQEIKATVKLALPVVVGQLGQMMMGLVDSVMVGRVGAVPLAAISLANGIFFLILVFGIGLSQAVTPLVAESVGAGKPERCGIWLRQGMLVSLGAGLLLAVITYTLADIIPYLNQPAGVAHQAMVYLKIMGISVLPIMLFQGLRQYSEGLSIMWPAMIIALCANGLNVFFNWLLIFGHWGFPALGLRGAGYSTFATRTLMMAAMTAYVLNAVKYKAFRLPLFTRHFQIDRKKIRAIINIGTGTGFQYVFEVGAFSGAAVMIGWLGTPSLAAHQITLSNASISFMFAVGISAAASIRVGKAKGEKNLQAMRRAGFAAYGLSVIVMSVFAVIFVVFRYSIPKLFITNPAVINLAAPLFIIAALFQVSDGLQATGLGILRGIADVKIPTIATFVSYWIIGLPAAYLLGVVLDMKVKGVWYGLLLGLTSSAVLLTTRFHLKTKPAEKN